MTVRSRFDHVVEGALEVVGSTTLAGADSALGPVRVGAPLVELYGVRGGYHSGLTNASGDTTITFPTGAVGSPPIVPTVVVTLDAATVLGGAHLVPVIQNTSTTQCRFRTYSGAGPLPVGSAVACHWVAWFDHYI